MIERQTIHSREATVAYLTADFQPATRDTAKLVKVIFEDGETVWLAPQSRERQAAPGQSGAARTLGA
jgi:hypothetical protein